MSQPSTYPYPPQYPPPPANTTPTESPPPQTKHARALNRLSFYYSGYSLRGGDEYLSAESAKTKALEVIEEAIAMFKEV